MAGPRASGLSDSAIPASAGIGLRFQHHAAVLEQKPPVGWMEVHPENYMGAGMPLRYLEAIRRDYPISLHGVALSLGSADGLNDTHLARLRSLAERIEPGLVSEHMSWSIADGTYLADLLPLPMTQEALDVVCRNIDAAQSYLRRRILLENPSSYLRYHHSTIPEWEFIAEVARRTGCGILCDVNNIYVSSYNHGFDPSAYLMALPIGSVGEIHLAGHALRDLGNGRAIRIDDHGSCICADVWLLYELAIARFGHVPTLIEWDTDIPPLPILLREAEKAQNRLTLLPRQADHADSA
ncbi:MAG TPA: DUF692 domain-containing protein [Rhodopila sp.]|nr:DUF692 domain-containing protein [Rhodopila sp.]